jgi:hypothetical protein
VNRPFPAAYCEHIEGNVTFYRNGLAYSASELVALSTFMGRWNDGLMTIFTVYFDGSGAPDDSAAVCVAGFVAEAQQWLAFERNWQDVLLRFDAPPLHMRRFAHSIKEFSSWKGDEKRRSDFVKALISVIKLRVRHSFASAVVMKDYNEIATRFAIRESFSPFALTGCTCISKVRRWARKWAIDENSIKYVFEDGDKDKTDLFRCADKHFGVSPIFLKKGETVAFQAADLLAYEYLLSNRKIYQVGPGTLSLSELRKSLQALNTIPNGNDAEDWGVHDIQSLERACNEGLLRAIDVAL